MRLQGESPSRSQLNGLGTYILVALLFVFGTMVEFAFVLIIKQKIDRSKDGTETRTNRNLLQNHGEVKSASCGRRAQYISPSKDDVKSKQSTKLNNNNNQGNAKLIIFKGVPLTAKIDYLAFIIFVILYLIFNIIYFNI